MPVEEVPQIAASGASPEDSSITDARHGLLYRAIARLGDKNREMILLREIQELKLEEIADMLGLPIGTVKSRSHRARLELAEAFAAPRGSAGLPPTPRQCFTRSSPSGPPWISTQRRASSK